MWRRLLIGASLAVAACGTPPGPGLSTSPDGAPRTVQNLPEGAGGRASDAAPLPFGGDARLPRLRGAAPDDERPSWLPNLPRELERHPVPDRWPNDTLVLLLPPPG
jgi:hypothetical protein